MLQPQIREQISNMNFHSWAVLGSRGCREKKIQTAISMQLLRPVFYVFMGIFFLKLFFALENIKKHLEKVHTYGSWDSFFLCSPDCPKQPRTSFPFYKFFYTTISGRIPNLCTVFPHIVSSAKKISLLSKIATTIQI